MGAAKIDQFVQNCDDKVKDAPFSAENGVLLEFMSKKGLKSDFLAFKHNTLLWASYAANWEEF